MVLTSKEIIAPLFQHEPEEFQSSLNVNKTNYLKGDPLASIINFQRHRDSDHPLSNWSRKLNSPISLVSKATHLITKEMIQVLQGAVIILQFFPFCSCLPGFLLNKFFFFLTFVGSECSNPQCQIIEEGGIFLVLYLYPPLCHLPLVSKLNSHYQCRPK